MINQIYIGDQLEFKKEIEFGQQQDDVLPIIGMHTSGNSYVRRHRTDRGPTIKHVNYTFSPTSHNLHFINKGLNRSYGIFGKSGSGKTTFIRNIVQQLLSSSDQATGGLIVDPKQDYDEIERYVENDVFARIHFVQPSKATEKVNILAAPLPVNDRGAILGTALYLTSNPSEQYWIDNLIKVLGAVITCLEIIYDRFTSVKEVVKTVTSYSKDGDYALTNTVGLVNDTLKSNHKPNGHTLPMSERRKLLDARSHLMRFIRSEKRAVQENILYQGFGSFLDQKHDHLSRQTKFHELTLYEELLCSEKVLIAQPDRPGDKTGSVMMAMIRLMFQSCVLAKKQIFAKHQIQDLSKPVFIIVDEFHTSAFDKPEFKIGDNSFISQARAFNCFNLIATQNIAQLKALPTLDNNKWEALLSNLECLFFLRCDAETAEYASKQAGKEEVLIENTSHSTSASGTSYSSSTTRNIENKIPAGLINKLDIGKGMAVGTIDGKSSSSVNYFLFYQSKPIKNK